MEKLKPCPFCGGEASLERSHHTVFGDGYWVECENTNCPCNPHTIDFRDEDMAVNAWNERLGQDRQRHTCKTCSFSEPAKVEVDGKPLVRCLLSGISYHEDGFCSWWFGKDGEHDEQADC